MSSLDLTYAPYKMKFKEPFVTSKGPVEYREGLILFLTSSSGAKGAGECAPLPDYGSETYENALSKLNDFELNMKLDLADLEHSISACLSDLNDTPALRHGIEQSLLSLISKEKNISFNELLNCSSKTDIKVNDVIGMLTPEETASKAYDSAQNGFTAVKIKIGRDNFEEDLAVLKAVREKTGQDLKLRTDANGKWNKDDAIKNLNALEQIGVEYCEQPVGCLQDFISIKEAVNIPVAADESIRSYKDAVEFINEEAAKVLIIKPMLLGGIIPAISLINLAAANGIKTVVSSSFESAVGRAGAAFTASTVSGDIAHGLNTGKFFEKDLTEDPYPVINGMISLK